MQFEDEKCISEKSNSVSNNDSPCTIHTRDARIIRLTLYPPGYKVSYKLLPIKFFPKNEMFRSEVSRFVTKLVLFNLSHPPHSHTHPTLTPSPLSLPLSHPPHSHSLPTLLSLSPHSLITQSPLSPNLPTPTPSNPPYSFSLTPSPFTLSLMPSPLSHPPHSLTP